jgi:hypothetical protein
MGIFEKSVKTDSQVLLAKDFRSRSRKRRAISGFNCENSSRRALCDYFANAS